VEQVQTRDLAGNLISYGLAEVAALGVPTDLLVGFTFGQPIATSVAMTVGPQLRKGTLGGRPSTRRRTAASADPYRRTGLAPSA
jgi:hypothetical protein